MNFGIPVSFKHEGSQYYINRTYLDYVKKAGHTATLLTPDSNGEFDALLLPGGIDIDPIHYGYNNDSCSNTSPEMDAFWRQLLAKAILKEMPIFGICRGFQMLFLETQARHRLYQDFMYEQHFSSHPQSEHRNKVTHFVESFYDRNKAIPVNSMHHQGVLINKRSNMSEESYKQLLMSGEFSILPKWIFDMGKTKWGFIVESAYFNNRLNKLPAFGVQWHPEELGDISILNNYLEEFNAIKGSSE